MSTNTTKVVYIGAGTDIVPVLDPSLPHFDEYIFIDSRPNNEYGNSEWNIPGFYCKNFISNLKKVYKHHGFTIASNDTENSLIIFTGMVNEKEKTVYYFYSVAFPEHVNNFPLLKNKLHNFDALIVCGYDPDSSILNYGKNQITIIGNDDTVYSYDEMEDIKEYGNNLMYKISKNPSLYINKITNYFKSFVDFNDDLCVNELSGKMCEKYNTFHEFIGKIKVK